MDVKFFQCPNDGSPIDPAKGKCDYCDAKFMVNSLADLARFDKVGVKKYISQYNELHKANPDDGELNCAMGVCYLDLGLHELASRCFAKAVENVPEQADVYYYYAISLMKGKRPRVLSLTEIRRVEEYLGAAVKIDESKAKYYYLLAAVRRDFYEGNGLKAPPPTFAELVAKATAAPRDEQEIAQLVEVVPAIEGIVLGLTEHK